MNREDIRMGEGYMSRGDQRIVIKDGELKIFKESFNNCMKI